MHTYSILSVAFYDVMQQQYIKILCINAVPVVGALAARVKTVRPPRLSGLCGVTPGGNANNCIHAILAGGPGHPHYMTPDQLPELFAFLLTNGYTVDTALTKLAAKHQSGGAGCGTGPNGSNANSLVCLISYNS